MATKYGAIQPTGFTDYYGELWGELTFLRGTGITSEDDPSYVAPGEGIDHRLNAFKSALSLFYTTDGSNLKLDRYLLNSSHVWSFDSLFSGHAGTSPSIERAAATRLSVCYVQTGSAKHASFDYASGEVNVQTIGTGTLVVHKLDPFGRMICAVYNSGWKVQVGTLDTGGNTWTFSSQVSMGISAAERRGSLEFLDGRKISFAYIDNSNVAKMVICKSLSNDGTGVWA